MNLGFTDEQISEGRRLLKRLLPELRREISLASVEGALQPTSRIGQSMMMRVRAENLDALVIRRSAGGWHADVVLTGMPVGVSNVMGTPEAAPLPDRDAALAAGTQILRQLCRLSMENELAVRDMPERDIRPFDLHGYTFEIPGEMVDRIGEVWEAVGPALVPDAATARAQLTGNLVRLMGGTGSIRTSSPPFRGRRRPASASAWPPCSCFESSDTRTGRPPSLLRRDRPREPGPF